MNRPINNPMNSQVNTIFAGAAVVALSAFLTYGSWLAVLSIFGLAGLCCGFVLWHADQTDVKRRRLYLEHPQDNFPGAMQTLDLNALVLKLPSAF